MRIVISRHGESLYNLEQRIGGNPSLSESGHKYAVKLSGFFKSYISPCTSYSSTKKRVIDTISYCETNYTKYSELDEINAGICEDLTYDDVIEKYPEEFQARKKDKLNYRYPEGESYTDIVDRVSPIVDKILLSKDNTFIVCHQAISRALLYLFGIIGLSEIPNYNIPLHHVLILTGDPGKFIMTVKEL